MSDDGKILSGCGCAAAADTLYNHLIACTQKKIETIPTFPSLRVDLVLFSTAYRGVDPRGQEGPDPPAALFVNKNIEVAHTEIIYWKCYRRKKFVSYFPSVVFSSLFHQNDSKENEQ